MVLDIQKVITSTEEKICGYFNVSLTDVFSRNKKSDVVLARHFIIYILHSDYKVSLSTLEKRYNRCIRNITHICSNFSFLIANDKKYRQYYKELKIMIPVVG